MDEKFFSEAMSAVGLHPVVIDENTKFPSTRSCFLPGTQVQFAWDSTSLDAFKRCPRYYQYNILEGWEPHGEAIHLRFGIEYHQALHDYELYKVQGLNHDESLIGVCKDLLTRIASWDPDPRTKSEETKSKSNLVRCVIDYLDKHKEDPAETVILENGKPALEVSFRFELDFGPIIKTAMPMYDQPYILCGHLDRIVNYLGGVYGMDRKTSSSGLTDYYFIQYQPNNQMTLYSIAGKVVLESPIRGMIIDAVHVQEQPEFARHVTYRTQDQLDEWLGDLHFWFARAEACATEGYWPQNDTACTMYGGCRYREICSKSPAARSKFLQSSFRQKEESERWNPLKSR